MENRNQSTTTSERGCFLALYLPLFFEVDRNRGNKATLKKVCFMSSRWPKLWPVGRPQYLFFFGGGGGGGKKILKFLEKGNWQNEKKVPIMQLYPHPAAGPETIFFLRVA